MKGEYRHVPVMLEEVVAGLAVRPGDVVVDCTLGGAGHASALAASLGPEGLLIGLDQDPEALAAAEARLAEEAPEVPRRLVHAAFGDLDDVLLDAAVAGVDAFLFDLGVSSHQLDEASRGFSYHADAPLDMRLDPGKHTKNALEVTNTYHEADLARILSAYGQERHAHRIARAIVEARARAPITTTTQLAEVVKGAYPARERAGRHPARKVFQALRIEVNGELEQLEVGLEAAIRWLMPAGRIAVISYHSLEDSIVKRTFAELAQGCTCPPELAVCVCGRVPILDVMTKRPLVPTEGEVAANRRARSAKLRIAQRTGALLPLGATA